MSASIVDNETINLIVSFLSINHVKAVDGFTLNDVEDCQRLASDMLSMNHEAIRARYDGESLKYWFEDCPSSIEYRFSNIDDIDIFQILKSLQYFLYQCAEDPIPDSSELYQALRKIEKGLIIKLIHDLPEFKASFYIDLSDIPRILNRMVAFIFFRSPIWGYSLQYNTECQRLINDLLSLLQQNKNLSVPQSVDFCEVAHHFEDIDFLILLENFLSLCNTGSNPSLFETLEEKAFDIQKKILCYLPRYEAAIWN